MLRKHTGEHAFTAVKGDPCKKNSKISRNNRPPSNSVKFWKITEMPIIMPKYFWFEGVRDSVLPPVSNSSHLCFPDPRVDLLGYRYIGLKGEKPESNLNFSSEPGNLGDYVYHRFAKLYFITQNFTSSPKI